MLAIILLSLLAMLIGGVYVGASLGFVGYALGETFAFFPVTNAFGQIAWSVSHNFILVAAPLFILMGQLLLTSGVSDRKSRT
jgi:TRAP-type mannitol/chloroaromatic compound transport system permease large subunit